MPSATGTSPTRSPSKVKSPMREGVALGVATATSMMCSYVVPVELTISNPWVSPATQG